MSTPTKNDPSQPSQRDWLLVVDDEERIREFLTAGLESDTLEVLTAPDGPTALKILDQRDTDPLVVAMDVLMPGGIDGLTLARKLGSRLSRTKIVLMSGHLSDDSWWPTDLREVVFLAKPFRIAQLLELIMAARTELRGGS